MAKEYIVINNSKETKLGLIALSKHVIESITKYTIEEEKDFILNEPTPLRRPVYCKVVGSKLTLSCDVKVRYGVNVHKACEMLQEKINQLLLQTTDLRCTDVQINVTGFVF